MNKYEDAVDAAAWNDVDYSYSSAVEDGKDSFDNQIIALEGQLCREGMEQSVASALAKSVSNRIQMASDKLEILIATGVMPEVKVRESRCIACQQKLFLALN